MESTRRQFIARSSMAAAGAAVLSTAPAFGASPVTALTNVTVIDPASGTTRRRQTVLIRGDRIAAVGCRIPDGARVIDLRGKYLIPGLADMHVHNSDERIWPKLYLVNGVTTVREMSGTPQFYDARDRIENGSLLGPRLLVASPIIDGSPSLYDGSLPVPAISVAGPDAARRAVRRVKAEGADFVKVYSRLSAASLRAIADEARRQGLTFVGHLPDDVPIEDAVDWGMRGIEHLTALGLTLSSRDADVRRMLASIAVKEGEYASWVNQIHPIEWFALQNYSRARAHHVFRRLRHGRTAVVPTLTMHRIWDGPDDVDPNDPRLRYMPRADRQALQWWLDNVYRPNRTPEEIVQQRHLFRHRLRVVGAMGEAGVPVMAGTDTGTPWCFPGFSTHDELDLLVRAGFSPLDALRAATVEPARFMGRSGELGTVRRGASADLVVLDANPLTDIRNTQRIHSVTVRGRYIGPSERARMLADVEAAASQPAPPGPARPAGCSCMTR